MTIEQWMHEKTGKRKLLLASKMENANALLQGLDMVDVKVMNLSLLAKTCVIESFAVQGVIKEIKMIDSTLASAIISKLLEEHGEELSFVPQVCRCDETSAEICRVITMVRENPKDTRSEIEDKEKWRQIKRLTDLYEAYLEENDLYDRCRLILSADEALKNGTAKVEANMDIGLLDDGRLPVIEKRFLETIFRSCHCVITPVTCGVENKDVDFTFFKAYGKANEIAYIIRDIEASKIPLGEIAVYYSAESYLPFLKSLFGSKAIPIRFLSGVPASALPPVDLMLAVLDWAASDYDYQAFQKVMRNCTLSRIGANEGSVHALRRFYSDLREEIGWGKERYMLYAQRLQEKSRERISQDEAAADSSARDLAYADFLTALCACFDDERPLPIFDALGGWIQKYTADRKDQAALYQSLMVKIRPLIAMKETENLPESIKVIKKALEQLKIKDSISASAVLAKRLDEMTVMDRKYNYVIGLSQSAFHRNDAESPVLSDAELTQLLDCEKGNVVLKKELDRRRKENYFKSFAACAEGEIHLGYTDYDTVSLRPDSASPFFLNCYEKFGKGKEIVEINAYPDIINTGIKILKPAADQTIIPSEENHQRESGRNRIKLSASELSILMNCPLHYRFRYIDHLPNAVFLEKDDDRWLPENKKGSFIHKVLEIYCTEAFTKKDVTDVLNESLYQMAFEQAKKEAEGSMPVLSAHQQQHDLEAIDKILRAEIERLHQQFFESDWRVYACELAYDNIILLSFDSEGKEAGNAEEGVDIAFKGFIDRVDCRMADGVRHFRIIDYKTGRPETLKEDIDNNNALQHVIYALALKKLEPNAFIDEMIYDMVYDGTAITVKGKDLLHLPEDVTARILQTVFGIFDAPDLSEMDQKAVKRICQYCHYQDICIQKIGEVL